MGGEIPIGSEHLGCHKGRDNPKKGLFFENKVQVQVLLIWMLSPCPGSLLHLESSCFLKFFNSHDLYLVPQPVLYVFSMFIMYLILVAAKKNAWVNMLHKLLRENFLSMSAASSQYKLLLFVFIHFINSNAFPHWLMLWGAFCGTFYE